jgi:ABC-type transport system involved in multi-copper enzyme maturation permease subunit
LSTEAMPVGRVTQRRINRSEWTKLRSVRSTRWSLLVALLLLIGLGLLACAIREGRWNELSAEDRLHFHSLRLTLGGVNFAQLAFGVLGVLVITAEYSTGMIRSSLSAVPRRLPVLWGKATVFGLTCFVVSLPAVFIAFFACQGVLSAHHESLTLSHSGVLRAVLGAALYLMVIGLFGLGLGAIFRNTAGGIAALVGFMFLLPPIVALLPTSTQNAIDPYLPANAGGAVWTITPDPNTLHPWVGLLVFAGYAALSIAIAAVLMVRRDT